MTVPALHTRTLTKRVVAGVCGGMVAWVWALALLMGAALDLPGGSGAFLARSGGEAVAVALLTLGLMPAVAFVAGWGRGYMAPMGFALLTLFLAQVVAATGHGGAFPWAVPALFSGAAGPRQERVGMSGYVAVVLTAAVGITATLVWWRRADHA